MKRFKGKPKKATKKQHFYTVSIAIIIGLAVTGAAFYALFSVVQQMQRSNTPFSKSPTWVQDFTASKSTSIDPTVWHYSTNPDVPGYNNEKQAYTSLTRNVRVEPGVELVIEAHKNDYQYPGDPLARTFEYTSGRIDTRYSLNFEYGKVEATIKLPKGRGVWPAFWLLSANEPYARTIDDKKAFTTDTRLYMKDGEIDIMEYYGDPHGLIEATLHTYAHTQEKQVKVTDYADTFHTYGVEIQPSKIIWTIDNVPYFSYYKTSDNTDEWPFGNGNQLYVILNLAMGGDGGGEINDSDGPWQMQIKNVKYYDYIGKNTY